MENKAFPAVKVSLDKERTIIVSLGALAQYERASGKRPLAGEFDGKSASDTLYMLWACLHEEDKTLTVDQVGLMLTAEKLVEAPAALNKAIVQAFPTPKGKSDDPLVKGP